MGLRQLRIRANGISENEFWGIEFGQLEIGQLI